MTLTHRLSPDGATEQTLTIGTDPTYRRARATAIICAMVAILLATSCSVQETDPKDGTSRSRCKLPFPWGASNPAQCKTDVTASAKGVPITSIPEYTQGPEDGSGWSTQPMDQPRPMPSPNYDWYQHELQNCAWTTPDLLTAMGWTGGELATGPVFCAFSIGPGEQLQIHFDGPYNDWTTQSDVAFMRHIEIAGLEAREYDLGANQTAYPGSCTVEVNTRSTGGITVLGGAAETNPIGTDPAPMCQHARDAATLLAKTFTPLAGGTPWSNTPQHPAPTAIDGTNACVVTYGHATAETLLATEGKDGNDGDATTCTYANGGIKITVWLSAGVSNDWQAAVPSLGKDELTETTQLGTMPAYRQFAPSDKICGEAVRYVEGQVLHVAYENRDYDGDALCRVAELIVGSAVNKMADVVG